MQSRASWPLIATTVAIMAVGVLLPPSPIGSALGFVPLPPRYWPILAVTLLAYMSVTQLVKAVPSPRVDLRTEARQGIADAIHAITRQCAPSPHAMLLLSPDGGDICG